ncbi:polymer-forming cytoskeletal protein [Parahaliea aestuarii]|uniref:Polymer-forming cytoskeletal protein n=1 Tax=Parahaliea aestuarii TaxID=1852021 RepID=A0A5C9A060_9GAMM|nr:polymer-forming cytoskeletal protein [Parahaliea aestuarii]
MFERNKDKGKASERPAPAPAPAPAAATPEVAPPPSPSQYQQLSTPRNAAVIGPSIKIKGEVSGDEDLVIRGTVEGSIDLAAHEVTVGESGKVKADIKGRTVIVNGEVTGDITGGEKVIIAKTGHVRGNIIAPRMTLEDGAVFKGSIDMDPGEKNAAKPAPAPAAKPAAAPTSSAPGLDLKSG